MMLAVLPRRQADDLAGELFVAAYEQALWRYSEHAMQYLTQRAIAEKKWFPTVKECLDILEDWRRPQADYQDHAKRQNLAEAAIRAEREARAEERREEGRKFLAKLRAGEVPQAEIDALHDSVVFEFRKLGVLRWNRETEKFEAVRENIA